MCMSPYRKRCLKDRKILLSLSHSQAVYIIYTNRRGGLYRTPRFVYCCYNESFPTLTGIKILDIDVV